MEDFLPQLDVDKIREFPAELGAFDSESLCVRYSFAHDEYTAAMRSLPDANELPDHLKTVVHEKTHLLHFITTPFGLLIYRLRGLQTFLVSDAVRTARGHGHAVAFPLQKTFRTLPGPVAREVEQRIQVWYGVELLILILMGEIDVWQTHILTNPYLRGVTLAELFAQIQYYLVQRQAGPDVRAEPEKIDAENAGIEGTLLATDLLLGGANTLAIIESAGTASEYFGSTRLTLDQFKAEVEQAAWSSTTAPKSWLIDGLRSVCAASLPEFILSYLALCEVALFGPSLPEHRPLRTRGINVREMLPFLRWFDLIHAASQVPPMTSLADYGRYTAAVCRAAGFTPPGDVVDASVAATPEPPHDPSERAYWKAQRMRRDMPAAFLNYPSILARLPMEFDFPVITYRDRTLFLKDKLLLHQFVLGYLTRAVVRRMLLRQDLAVTMPYAPTTEETAFYTAELAAVLEGGLGYRVTGIALS